MTNHDDTEYTPEQKAAMAAHLQELRAQIEYKKWLKTVPKSAYRSVDGAFYATLLSF